MNALLGTEIGDPAGTLTVYAVVASLVVLGIGLVVLAFWLRRSTRPDPELLAPLELMGERSWLKADKVSKRRRLDEVRPPGAVPLKRSTGPRVIVPASQAATTVTHRPAVESEAPAASGAVVIRPRDADRPATADEIDSRSPSDNVVAGDDGADRPTDGTMINPASGDGGIDAGAAVDEGRSASANGDGRDGVDDDVPDAGAPTPAATERPIDDFSDNDIDPELIQQAIAELDAELDSGR